MSIPENQLEAKYVFVVNNNVTLLMLYALQDKGYLSFDNTLVLITERVNSKYLGEFIWSPLKMYHNCPGFSHVICIRKFVRKVKEQIKSLSINSYHLIVSNMLNIAYQIIYFDSRCIGLSFIEEGTLSYVLKAPLAMNKMPFSKYIYGSELLRRPIPISNNYTKLYSFNKESFGFDSENREIVSIPTSIKGYYCKATNDDVIVALPKAWEDWSLNQRNIFQEKVRDLFPPIFNRSFIKPHPSHYLNKKVMEEICKSYFDFGKVDVNNEVIIELEVTASQALLVTPNNSLADILPSYGCNIKIVG